MQSEIPFAVAPRFKCIFCFGTCDGAKPRCHRCQQEGLSCGYRRPKKGLPLSKSTLYIDALIDQPDLYNPLLTLTIGNRPAKTRHCSAQSTNEGNICTNPDILPSTAETSQATSAREFLSKSAIAPLASKPRQLKRAKNRQRCRERYFCFESPLLQLHKTSSCAPSTKVLNALFYTSEFQRLLTFEDTRARDQMMAELMSLITTRDIRVSLSNIMLSTQFPHKRRRIEPITDACVDIAGDTAITPTAVLNYCEILLSSSGNNDGAATDSDNDDNNHSIDAIATDDDYDSDAIEVKAEPGNDGHAKLGTNFVKKGYSKKPSVVRAPLRPRLTEFTAVCNTSVWDPRSTLKGVLPYKLDPDEPLFVTGPPDHPRFRTLCPKMTMNVHRIGTMYNRLIPRYFFDRLTPENQVVLPLPSSDLLHTFHGAVIQDKLAKKRQWAFEWGSPASLLCFSILLQEYMYHLLMARGT